MTAAELPRLPGVFFLVCVLCSPGVLAQPAPEKSSQPVHKDAAPASAATSSTRPRLGSAAQRNENVVLYLIDTNAIKEANVRLGGTATAVAEPLAESQYFATEHARPPSEVLGLRPQPAVLALHGEGYWWHQNSVLNSRTFFQVGPVKPSHRNLFGGRLTGVLPHKAGYWSGTYGQRDIRGMVNGNVLVPLANERTPRATDPAKRAMIERWLKAYPDSLPNRPDFDPRMLNTNSSQRIDSVAGAARVDLTLSQRSKLMLSDSLDRTRILAFELVAGQNPDTELHNHRSALTWSHQPSAGTTVTLGATFQRNVSALLPEPNAVGPRVRVGTQIEDLGPESMFPTDRATNSFRYGGAVSQVIGGGRHTLTWGGDVTRFQLNGIEANNSRGYFQFSNNYGRTAVENFLTGTPTMYEVTLGDLDRGYRNWAINGYFADRWRLHARFQLYAGVRYNAELRPVEVNRREIIPYASDWNNFSPRLSFAWQATQGWVVRAMYVTSFSEIQPVTYQQVRNNPPNVMYFAVPDTDLTEPLRNVDQGPNARTSPTYLSADLTSPYSHQYNFTLERRLAGWALLRTSYIGSRTIKLLNSYVMNRAVPAAGIPLTTATVDQRRPDSRFYEVKWIVNGGNAYLDAGQVALDFPLRRGFTGNVAYTFSKAIDEGPDYSATAANKDLMNSRSQSQYESFNDRRGLSNFDSPHALMVSYVYEIPAPHWAGGWLRAAMADWTIAGVNLWKQGTPLTLYIGSDGPGFGNVDGSTSDRPSIVDPSILGMTIGDPNTSSQIIRRDRFDYIHPGDTRGNLGKNTFRKARIWNWNASLTRQFRLPNETLGQLRVDAYNLTNTPQFDEPQHNLTSPSFGRITNTLNDGRVFQFGFRFLF